MEVRRARPGFDVDVRASSSPILRVVERSLDFELLNGVRSGDRDPPLRANIDETVLPVIITEQGENRNQCEEQRDLFGFSYGLACRGT